MIYPMMCPPFSFDDFATMTKKQAEQHFDWYVSSIPERVQLLEMHFNGVWQHSIRFDYSVESLDQLWEAFERHIGAEACKKEHLKEEKIRYERMRLPIHVIADMQCGRRELTRATRVVALDIGMYFGEVVVRHLPGIRWGYFIKPKNLSSVNQPVLLGFKGGDYMDPRQVVLTGCWKSIEAANPHFLREALDVWRAYL